MITQLLRAEGWKVNRKRVQRVRRRAELQVVRKRHKTKRQQLQQAERVRAQRPNQVRSYDFIHDRLENGAGLKMLTGSQSLASAIQQPTAAQFPGVSNSPG